jgi:hypothetical protein
VKIITTINRTYSSVTQHVDTAGTMLPFASTWTHLVHKLSICFSKMSNKTSSASEQSFVYPSGAPGRFLWVSLCATFSFHVVFCEPLFVFVLFPLALRSESSFQKHYPIWSTIKHPHREGSLSNLNSTVRMGPGNCHQYPVEVVSESVNR